MGSLIGYTLDRKRKSTDTIGSLPDDLLCHILSFLSTKEAALASVVSKRWSNLLQSLPNLDFDDSVLLHPQKGQPPKWVFEGFVDRLLSLRFKSSSPLHRVSLKCRERDRVLQWIWSIVSLNVMDLDLSVSIGRCCLPLSVFTSKTLVNLRIGTRISLAKPHSCVAVCDVVKSLVLDSVKFGDPKDGFDPILSAFPSVKDLRIYESKNWNYWNGSVSIPTLESLTYKRDDDDATTKTCVSFDTPNVVYLEYSDMVADKYENVNLNSLVEAKLDLRMTANQIMRKTTQDSIGYVPGDVTPLFMRIRHVKILCFSPDALEALYYRGEKIPVFTNLISLSIGSDKPHGSPFIFWKLLPSLLLNSLNLETLIIKGLVHYVTKAWETYSPGSPRFSWDDVCDSLSSCAVKILKITRYKGTSQEVKSMKRFLGRLSRLEMVRIDHNASDNGERCRLMEDILHLRKASSNCKIQFMKEAI